jgi:hypothetical protein
VDGIAGKTFRLLIYGVRWQAKRDTALVFATRTPKLAPGAFTYDW